jgi:hypothetical protein
MVKKTIAKNPPKDEPDTSQKDHVPFESYALPCKIGQDYSSKHLSRFTGKAF